MKTDSTNLYLHWAKDFENLAETYREARPHGPANDAEAWKGMSLALAKAARTPPTKSK